MEVLGLLLVWPAFGAPDWPKVGAIRWDAWYGGQDPTGAAVEASLGPERWHHRLPFCAEVVGPSQVRIDCAKQTVMDQEIDFARLAGIDYWAFATFAPDRLMNASLNLYLASEKRDLVNFALLTGVDLFGDPREFPGVRDRFVSLMKERGYQTVLGNRPLLFLGFVDNIRVQARWGGYERLREAFQGLRDHAAREGVGNPYIVLMDFSPQRAEKLRQALGFDAVSSYATQGNAIRAKYSQLTAHARRFWKRAKASGGQVVPIAMTGWDRRPRVQNPVPWEQRSKDPELAMQRYYAAPSPQELADHVAEAVRWVWSHPSATEANAILVYAWNEFDEGGWIAPTLGEGDARVRALGERMRALRAVSSGASSQR